MGSNEEPARRISGSLEGLFDSGSNYTILIIALPFFLFFTLSRVFTLLLLEYRQNKVPALSFVIASLSFSQIQARSNHFIFLDSQDQAFVRFGMNRTFDGQTPLLIFSVFRFLRVLANGCTRCNGTYTQCKYYTIYEYL